MKKLVKAYVFFSLLAIITGCTEEDDTVKNQTSRFIFIVNENYIKENERKWILIYNNRNNLISEKELANNSETELAWEPEANDSLYTVQIIRALIEDNDESYEIFTYTQVEPETWILNGAQVAEKPAALGENKISFSDFDPSDYTYRIITNLGHGISYALNNTFTVTQHYNPDKIWMRFHNVNEAPYYCLLDNVTLNEEFILSANELSQMEDYIEYEFPTASYSDVYLHADQVFENNVNPHFQVYNLFQYESANSIRVYYPGNLFSSYNFSLAFRAGNVYEAMYYRGAAPPATIIRMDASEEINDYTIQNFNTLFTGEAGYADHVWEYGIYDNQNGDKIFRYHVYSAALSNFSYLAPELPSFYTDLNSNILNLNNLEFNETRFFQYDYSEDYNDFIVNTFINPELADNYTLRLIKVVNN